MKARPGSREQLVIATKVAGPSRGYDWIRDGSQDLTGAQITQPQRLRALERRLLEAADRPNMGILVDALHWSRSDSTLDDVRALLERVQQVDAQRARVAQGARSGYQRCPQ